MTDIHTADCAMESAKWEHCETCGETNRVSGCTCGAAERLAAELEILKAERLISDAAKKDADMKTELADRRIAAAMDTVKAALQSRALWRDRADAAESRAAAAEARLAEAVRLLRDYHVFSSDVVASCAAGADWLIGLQRNTTDFLASLPKGADHASD